jgi:hypothetical protein
MVNPSRVTAPPVMLNTAFAFSPSIIAFRWLAARIVMPLSTAHTIEFASVYVPSASTSVSPAVAAVTAACKVPRPGDTLVVASRREVPLKEATRACPSDAAIGTLGLETMAIECGAGRERREDARACCRDMRPAGLRERAG